MGLVPWPIGNLILILQMQSSSSHAAEPTPPKDESHHGGEEGNNKLEGERIDATKGHWAYELIGRTTRNATYAAVAVLAYVYTFPLEAAGLNDDWSWVGIVVARNVLVLNFLYGSWHWVMYMSPWASDGRFADKKYNPVNQYADKDARGNLRREIMYCNLGFLMSSAYECLLLRLWATGRLPMLTSFWATPAWSIAHMLLVPYLRDGHFYFAHRVMHPWCNYKKGDVGLPLIGTLDPGAILYARCHSLHHKSYNPGPFSGLSMHPLEHLIYYSCTLVPLLCTVHPVHFLFNKFHADISPLPGHDGFDEPGGASYYHYLHHAHLEVNFGTPSVPFDRLFGTHSDGSRWNKKGPKSH